MINSYAMMESHGWSKYTRVIDRSAYSHRPTHGWSVYSDRIICISRYLSLSFKLKITPMFSPLSPRVSPTIRHYFDLPEQSDVSDSRFPLLYLACIGSKLLFSAQLPTSNLLPSELPALCLRTAVPTQAPCSLLPGFSGCWCLTSSSDISACCDCC